MDLTSLSETAIWRRRSPMSAGRDFLTVTENWWLYWLLMKPLHTMSGHVPILATIIAVPVFLVLFVVGGMKMIGDDIHNAVATPRDAPKLRAHPAQVLHISGTIAPSLIVKLQALYVTTRRSCKEETNPLVGAEQQLLLVPLPIRHVGAHYEATMAFDRYHKGHCGWRPYDISYRINQMGLPSKMVNATPFIWVGTTGPHQHWIGHGTHRRLEGTPGGTATLPAFNVRCGLSKHPTWFLYQGDNIQDLITVHATHLHIDFLDAAPAPAVVPPLAHTP